MQIPAFILIIVIFTLYISGWGYVIANIKNLTSPQLSAGQKVGQTLGVILFI